MGYKGYEYPWTNLHELNLDWVIEVAKQAKELVDEADGKIANKLDKDGDLIGTWFGDTKTALDARINAKLDETDNFLGTWFGYTLAEIFDKIENGNFTGTWFGETKASMDNRIQNGNFLGTWGGLTLNDVLNLITNGDFKGTWKGETKEELDLTIDGINTGYQAIIDLLNQNANSFITMEDSGYVFDTVTDTQDYGLVTDPVTDDIDDGYVINPCQCG